MTRPARAAFLVMAACAWVLWTGQPATKVLHDSVHAPARLGPWAGTVLSVAGPAEEGVEPQDVRLMEYRLGAELPVWLSLEGGQGKRASFHPPEICFVGSDFQILDRGPMTLLSDGAPRRLMRLVLSQNHNEYEAWYWFTVGDRITHSYYQQQLWLVLDAVQGKSSYGTLVRISTPRDTPQATHRRLLAFLTSYTNAPTVIAQLPSR